jgi:hypothetical protein
MKYIPFVCHSLDKVEVGREHTAVVFSCLFVMLYPQDKLAPVTGDYKLGSDITSLPLDYSEAKYCLK